MTLNEAKQQLATEVSLLMTHSDTEALSWTASKSDLMEILYCAYETETLRSDNGSPMPFLDIVRRCCRLLHVSVPSNPYHLARRARLRKGMRNMSYLDRYLFLVENNREVGLWKNIS